MSRLLDLLASCDDPNLLAFKLHPRQRQLLEAIETARVHVWCLGRRSGKTTMAALVCLHSCLFRPDLDVMVRPGERRYAVAVATNLQQARLLVDAARSIVTASPLLAELVESDTDDAITFTNGTVLRAFPCSSRGGRGWPISTLVLDEAAHFLTETDGFQTAERVWQALVPSTAQFGDRATIIAASTPYGTEGLFADLYSKAASGEMADASAHHATTAEANPAIPSEVLEAEHARDPDGFRQEYLAEFTASGDAYLDFDRFEISAGGELPPEEGTLIAGLDPAFRRDPFGLAIVGQHPIERGRLIVGCVEARKATRDFAGPVDAVAEVCKRYGARVVTDQYAAAAVVERMRAHRLSVSVHNVTAPSKTATYAELRTRLYDGTLALYPHPPLVAELRRLRAKFTAGRAAVENPRVGGSHGDIAAALALAVYEHRHTAARKRRPRIGGYVRNALGDHLREPWRGYRIEDR